jgi:hypothetical protein
VTRTPDRTSSDAPATTARRAAGGGHGAAAERLAHELAYPHATSIVAELSGWLVASPRFERFAREHRDKIRKKLRGARVAPALLDVRGELLLAYRLLADRRFELDFEAYGSGKGGPDFTARFRQGRPLNLEVTRPRRPIDADVVGATVLAKLRQLPPSAPNILVIKVEGPVDAPTDVETAIAEAVRRLRSQADAKDEAALVSWGFSGTRGFYDRFLRLGAVVAWSDDGSAAPRAVAWTNASARIGVPPDVLRGCLRCLGGR